MENQKESKKEPTLKDKVETIYEILSVHKVDIEYLEKKIQEMDSSLAKVKGRLGV
tara:strand:+ start:372 stop:536 length:165 start_codon:yes stop_codon:yes gene_type:complete